LLLKEVRREESGTKRQETRLKKSVCSLWFVVKKDESERSGVESEEAKEV